MKVQILSDIHNEFANYIPKQSPEANVVVLAGDIHTKNRRVEWAKQYFDIPVIYVLGNHEGYRKTIPKYYKETKVLAAGTQVNILEQDVVTINDINFLGCTLWTDFEIITNPRVAGFEC